ncbi:cysteine-rich receptor-like protein kinase 8, partial [Tanacetum coccineum]
MSPNLISPLFLHPSDGPSLLVVQEKLTAAQNYRSCRRFVEIRLLTKRKLGFKKVLFQDPNTDVNLQEQWDTCNDMIQLEKQFALSNSSRKYKLNREPYDVMQPGQPISGKSYLLEGKEIPSVG